ncbi:MAG TPA: hypothetical protein VKA68_15450 [bacterium]|nr:hypothetical protein [bacterium]
MGGLDQIKKELRELPEESLEEVDRYIHRLRQQKPNQETLPSCHLKGQYDHLQLRKLAYEEAVS